MHALHVFMCVVCKLEHVGHAGACVHITHVGLCHTC